MALQKGGHYLVYQKKVAEAIFSVLKQRNQGKKKFFNLGGAME